MHNFKSKTLVKYVNAFCVFFCAIAIVSGTLISAMMVYAGGGAGGDDDGGSKTDPGCIKGAKSDTDGMGTYYATQYDSCGAAFQLYDVNDTSNHPSKTSEISNAKTTCSKFGGKFYFLSLAQVRYNPAKDDVNYLGTFARSRTVSSLTSAYTGGSGHIPYIAKVGLPFADVKKDHDTALAYAKAHPEQDFDSFLSTDWSNVTWFCWNPEWENLSLTATSQFGAYSWVSSDESSEKGSKEDSGVFDSIITNSEKVKVYFKHQLGYNPPSDTAGKTFGAAGTNYNVKVTKNGSDVTSQASFTTSNSGSADINNNVFTSNSATWSPWLGQSSIEVDVPEGGSVKVCSTIGYDPKIIGWKESSTNNFVKDDSTTKNAGKTSQACLTIKRSKNDEKEEDGGQINFWSSSQVKLNGGNDLPVAQGDSDDKDDDDDKRSVTLKVSTDMDQIDVNFSHGMYKSHTARDGSTPMTSEIDDVWPSDVCTEYSVENSKDGSKDSGSYCHPADPDNIDASNYKTTIKTKQGSKVKVCSKIKYKPRTITLTRVKKTAIPLEIVGYEKITSIDEYPDEVYTKGDDDTYTKHTTKDKDGNTVYKLYSPSGVLIEKIGEDASGKAIYNWTGPENDWLGNPQAIRNEDKKEVYSPVYKKYYEYHVDEKMDDGWSEACIEVTKPDDPTMPPSVSGPNQGSNNPEFMYTGEDTSMYWDLSATNYETRRIIGFQQIIFQVNVQKDRSDGSTKGNLQKKPTLSSRNGTTDPCSYYNSKMGGYIRQCAPAKQQSYGGNGYKSNDTSWSLAHSDSGGSTKLSFQVPDYVGDKYCNSAGIKWGYWYGIFGGTSPNGWVKYGKEYWTNYDAACRTIVKKPSVSFWNGGMFTEGGVNTASSSRFNNPGFNVEISDSGINKDSTYGSWAEYLAVIKGQTANFTSGAGLAYNGNGQPTLNIMSTSALTISNVPSLGIFGDVRVGNSNITSTSTLRERLNNYIFNRATNTESNIYIPNPVNETIIYNVSGTARITHNIELSNAPMHSIYDLPQVIIYARDGIEIDSSVNRVDAWLVTDGAVDTCADNDLSVAGKLPQAHVNERSDSRDSACSRQLTINGPVISRGVKLDRTAGSDPRNYINVNPNFSPLSSDGGMKQAISGEVFDLSADTYLWAYVQAGRYKSSYTEAYSRELPPRY